MNKSIGLYIRGLFILLLLIAFPFYAEAYDPTTVIQGKVFNSYGRPMYNVVIKIDGRDVYVNEPAITCCTDKNGFFSVTIPFDKYRIEIIRNGYYPIKFDNEYNLNNVFLLGDIKEDSLDDCRYPIPENIKLENFHSFEEYGDSCYTYALYLLNHGMTYADVKVFSWFKISAIAGNAGGQYYTGYHYRTGQGVATNKDEGMKKALYWFSLAAEQEVPEAQYELGMMYEKGIGVVQSREKATQYYQRAADNKYEPAQNRIQELRQDAVKQICISETTIERIFPINDNEEEASDDISQKRIALIIGNGDYANGPLMNPVNDAKDMRAKLQQLGFEVMGTTNVESKGKMREQVRDFCSKAKNYDAALFFYSGHARQDNGVNYLIPTRCDIRSEADIEDQCLAMNWVVKSIQDTGAKNVIVLLDACRNSPPIASLTRDSGYSGLADMSAMNGTIIGYATRPGMVASDGRGQRNSPYTAALLKTLDIPGLPHHEFFQRVRKLVAEATGRQQIPTENMLLIDNFIFNLNQ